MKALVTGAGGLVGSAAAERLLKDGWEVIGLENDMRRQFFGSEASTFRRVAELDEHPRFRWFGIDIRSQESVVEAMEEHVPNLVIHTAAQPSHDWAARQPHVDFGVNAVGTLNLLEAARHHARGATFCHISTSKVYGDRPNDLPLEEPLEPRIGRYDLPIDHPFFDGITTEMSIDQCKHSLFGVSKAAGDLLVQEYGRYFDIPTVCFRPGCVTGPAHAGTELHGFLAYLVKCVTTGRQYTIYGYNGWQVRCNIHASDLVNACLAFHRRPVPGAVYNIGGGRLSACSMNEAIEMAEFNAGRSAEIRYSDEARIGDHKWWISDINQFRSDYPDWHPEKGEASELIEEIYKENQEQWQSEK